MKFPILPKICNIAVVFKYCEIHSAGDYHVFVGMRWAGCVEGGVHMAQYSPGCKVSPRYRCYMN